MARRTASEIYSAAVGAGLGSAAATIATAVALAESGGDDSQIGDVALETNQWGPSVGVWQIRTLKAETGSGSDRDVSALQGNLARQAQAMAHISGGGKNFTPWTTFTRGTYQQFSGQATGASVGSTAVPVTPVSDPTGIGATADKALAESKDLLVKMAFVTLGLGLVGFGLFRMAQPALGKATGELKKEAGSASQLAVLAA